MIRDQCLLCDNDKPHRYVQQFRRRMSCHIGDYFNISMHNGKDSLLMHLAQIMWMVLLITKMFKLHDSK